MTDVMKAIAEFGLSTGLLIAALYYIAFKTVPKHVYDSLCEQQKITIATVARFSEQLVVLLDREERSR